MTVRISDYLWAAATVVTVFVGLLVAMTQFYGAPWLWE